MNFITKYFKDVYERIYLHEKTLLEIGVLYERVDINFVHSILSYVDKHLLFYQCTNTCYDKNFDLTKLKITNKISSLCEVEEYCVIISKIEENLYLFTKTDVSSSYYQIGRFYTTDSIEQVEIELINHLLNDPETKEFIKLDITLIKPYLQ